MNPLINPTKRNLEGWCELFLEHNSRAKTTKAEILLIGDSIIKHFSRYKKVWYDHFYPADNINFGISGDCIQHVLWRVKFGTLPTSVKTIIIHVGTNNVAKYHPFDIAEGLVNLAKLIRQKSAANIVLTGLLPRGEAKLTKKIFEVNACVATLLQKTTICGFLIPDENWLLPDKTLNLSYFYKDRLHLSKEGYKNFSLAIKSKLSPSIPPIPSASLSSNNECAIGKFELVTETVSSTLPSPICHPDTKCKQPFTSFSLCQNDFPALPSSATTASLPLPVLSSPLRTTALSSCYLSCEDDFPALHSSASLPLPVLSSPLHTTALSASSATTASSITLATVHPSFLPFPTTVNVARKRCRIRKLSSNYQSTSRLKFIDFRNFDKLIGPSKLKL